MSASKTALFQKEAKNIVVDPSFCNRWVSATSLFEVLEQRYKFDDDYIITKAFISRSIGKIEPNIDDQKMIITQDSTEDAMIITYIIIYRIG